jgi:Protein of unknown function (DUF742)
MRPGEPVGRGFHDEPWFDDDAGRLVRPFTVSNGRTRPTVTMELLSLVTATGRVPRAQLELDHASALGLCTGPTTVAEIAAHLRLPVAVTKVLLSDLVESEAVTVRAPDPLADHTNRHILEKLLDALQNRV